MEAYGAVDVSYLYVLFVLDSIDLYPTKAQAAPDEAGGRLRRARGLNLVARIHNLIIELTGHGNEEEWGRSILLLHGLQAIAAPGCSGRSKTATCWSTTLR